MKVHVTLLIMFLESVSVSFGIDDARLKDRLTGGVFELVVWKKFDIKSLGASDEQLYRVLMDIYHEADDKWPTLTPGTTEWGQNRITMEGVFGCLPLCGSVPVKDFLLDYAVSKEKEPHTRTAALSSYLRVADAEEVKDVLLRFLVGEDRMGDYDRSSIYVYAEMAWNNASFQKKAAIFTALCEAAAVESPQWVFEECDSRLITMFPGHRDSPQRETMLRKQLASPFPQYYTELKDKMGKEVRRLEKMKSRSNVVTNGIILTARDFSIPQAEPLIGKNGNKRVQTGEHAEPEPSVTPPSRLRPAVPLVVGVGLLAALALLGAYFRRRR